MGDGVLGAQHRPAQVGGEGAIPEGDVHVSDQRVFVHQAGLGGVAVEDMEAAEMIDHLGYARRDRGFLHHVHGDGERLPALRRDFVDHMGQARFGAAGDRDLRAALRHHQRGGAADAAAAAGDDRDLVLQRVQEIGHRDSVMWVCRGDTGS